MFKSLLLLLLLTGLSLPALAQRADSIFVVPFDHGWAIRHKVQVGETVYTLARKYHAPPAMIVDLNKVSYQEPLKPGQKLLVPLGAYNFYKEQPRSGEFRRLSYRAQADESLSRIARNSGVSTRTLQRWNDLEYLELGRARSLTIGWVRYDQTELVPAQNKQETPRPSGGIQIEEDGLTRRRPVTTETIIISQPDTLVSADTLSEGEALFLSQTHNGSYVAEEKGTAAFFKRAGRSANGIYFAFHNVAKRGTIIKIFNPGTQKTIYAKVIGKVPVNGTFYNALLGISSDAKAELMTGADKAWCEISYAP